MQQLETAALVAQGLRPQPQFSAGAPSKRRSDGAKDGPSQIKVGKTYVKGGLDGSGSRWEDHFAALGDCWSLWRDAMA